MYSVLPTVHKRTIIHLRCPCSLFDIFFYCTYDSMFFVFSVHYSMIIYIYSLLSESYFS